MSAIILHHKSAPVTFDPPPADPRDPPVRGQDVAPDIEVNGENVCTGCGVLTRLHRSRLNDKWIGCAGALKQATELPSNPERWNDPFSHVTAAVRAAMLDGTCGPKCEIDMAHYDIDEQLTLAATLVRVAIAAYQREHTK